MENKPKGYKPGNELFDELEELIETVKYYEEYDRQEKPQRAFALALTNLQQARMWYNKALYEERVINTEDK